MRRVCIRLRAVGILTEEAHEVVYMRREAKNHKGEDENNAYTCRGPLDARFLHSETKEYGLMTATGGRD